MSETPKTTTPAEPVEVPAVPQPSVAPQQVQYVVQEKSLNGIGGWLLFWVIIFALAAIGYIMSFFSGLDAGVDNAAGVLSMIFSPILAIGAIATIITIVLHKKSGVFAATGTLGLMGLYTIINAIILASESGASLALTVGQILVSLLLSGLFILYFFSSKRVKQTLVK